MDVPFHGEFSSGDASALTEAQSRILLYKRGSTTAYTLQATDQVCITDVVISCGTTGVVISVYDGADNAIGAGELIARANAAANGGLVQVDNKVPHFCQLGTWPKVKTSLAGQVDVTIRGTLRRSP